MPRVFFEDTYIHPIDGTTRPNPLKYAYSLNGVSKDPKNQYVTRDPVLVNGPSDPNWSTKIGLFKLYHDQISLALRQGTFTSAHTQEWFGIPWANIVEFSENQPDKLYPYRLDFDGLFEQVHDNFHGWVGPDMADNTYTAFDPIFLSYHANMDRLAGLFMDAHPTNQFTSRFPLQPFWGSDAKTLSYDDPRKWVYTTIGDMAKDVRSLGYTYAPPVSADIASSSSDVSGASALVPGSVPLSAVSAVKKYEASGGRAITLPGLTSGAVAGAPGSCPADGPNKLASSSTKGVPVAEKVPYIVFPGVGCTPKSYRIDVFTGDATSLVPCPLTNPDFIGQVTRLGMGPAGESSFSGFSSLSTGGNGVGRSVSSGSSRKCRKPQEGGGLTRVLAPSEGFFDRLREVIDKIGGKTEKEEKEAEKPEVTDAIKLVVTDLETGQEVERETWEKLPGFEGRLVWLPVPASA